MDGGNNRKCVRLEVEGRVTGVGYRYWFARRAQELRLTGYVRNTSNETVEACVCGDSRKVDQIVKEAWSGPRWSSPAAVTSATVPSRDFHGFQIR